MASTHNQIVSNLSCLFSESVILLRLLNLWYCLRKWISAGELIIAKAAMFLYGYSSLCKCWKISWVVLKEFAYFFTTFIKSVFGYYRVIVLFRYFSCFFIIFTFLNISLHWPSFTAHKIFRIALTWHTYLFECWFLFSFNKFLINVLQIKMVILRQ